MVSTAARAHKLFVRAKIHPFLWAREGSIQSHLSIALNRVITLANSHTSLFLLNHDIISEMSTSFHAEDYFWSDPPEHM